MHLLIERGDERELDKLSRSPGPGMLRPLADWWYQSGQLDRLRPFANSSDGYIRRRLARLLDSAGLQTELEELATRSAAASRHVAERLVERGRIGELCERVVAGNGFARRILLHLVETGDPSVDAVSIRRFGLNPDGSVASQ